MKTGIAVAIDGRQDGEIHIGLEDYQIDSDKALFLTFVI